MISNKLHGVGMKKNSLLTFLSILTVAGSLSAAQEVSLKNDGDSSSWEANLLNLADEFKSNLTGQYSLDTSKMEKVGNYHLPTMKNGDWMLSDNPLPLVDSFTQRTSAFATIFVKSGNEFVRESTSLGTEKSNDAKGTTLSHNNPAYNSLMNEKRYTGEVELFGMKYMADYDVIRDKDGTVIGAYFVGIPISKKQVSSASKP